MRKIERVGVIGAGVMGVGVAQNLAQTQHQVILVDVSDQILDHARAEVYKNLRFARVMHKTPEQESARDILARINFTSDYAALSEADYIVENVVEKWEMKRQVYP